jgi:AcrR family transcriptional regulator
LRAAETLFVQHGFHGASMRDIAHGSKLPLATVVYHFARKEQLYAALLHEIGEALLVNMGTDLDSFVVTLVRWTIDEPGRVKLLLRELLDNPARVRKASQLPLAPFLERAATLVRVENPELAVLHAVGAVSYVVAAWPTVDRIVGAARAARLHAAYEREAIAFVRRSLGIEEPHGSRPAVPARSSRARAHRT